jgi:type IV pilus assembly protein PilQ
MISRKILLYCTFIVILFYLAGGTVVPAETQTDLPVITGITVQEAGSTTELLIDSNALFSYTIYKPADPYRLIVELQGVDQGKFTEKIVVDRAGVMEIIPSKLEGPAGGSQIEVILTVPADVQPVQKENSLILSFFNPEAEEMVVASEKITAPGETEEVLNDAKMIENIELSRSERKVYVLITGDGRLYPETFQPEANKLVVDIPGVFTAIESVRTYEPPVLGIRVGQQPDKTRIVIDVDESATHEISVKGKQVVLSFEKPMAELAGAPPAEEMISERPITEVRAFTGKEYTGEIISIDIQDAPLSKIFTILAEVSGFNMVISPQVKDERIFIKLDNIPWDHALDVILRNYGLSKSVEGNIIRIAPTKVIAEEEAAIARAKEAALKAGDLETKIYTVNFADLKQMKTLIDDLMKQRGGGGGGRERGTVSIDERTNTLIIRDVDTMHREYEKVISTLDTPTRQVAIEARIVEVTTNFTRELGIQWGVLVKPSPQTTVGGTGATEGSGFFTDTPFLVNLPAAVAAGTGGSVGFGYIGADSLRALDIQLSAMESSGNGKIISNPRIITLDNQEATIEQGKKIPYQTVSAEGTQTQFVDANLELTVTPHITPGGTIVMDIETKKNEADFSQTVAGVPTIDTNEAESQVLINDGDTLVIGGIFKTNISESLAYVPALGKIPILGWLFKTKDHINNTSELLIFITPRIIK